MSGDSSRSNYYDVLGVGADATPDEIRRAYRRRVQETNLDVRGGRADAGALLRLKRAYEVLANAEERARYDTIKGLGKHAERAGVYRRSYDRLLSSLFTGVRAAMDNRADLIEQLHADRRRAG